MVRRNFKDPSEYIGQAFHRLIIIGHGKKDRRGQQLWACRCACGKELDVPYHRLR